MQWLPHIEYAVWFVCHQMLQRLRAVLCLTQVADETQAIRQPKVLQVGTEGIECMLRDAAGGVAIPGAVRLTIAVAVSHYNEVVSLTWCASGGIMKLNSSLQPRSGSPTLKHTEKYTSQFRYVRILWKVMHAAGSNKRWWPLKQCMRVRVAPRTCSNTSWWTPVGPPPRGRPPPGAAHRCCSWAPCSSAVRHPQL